MMAYSASKAAVIGMVKSQGKELAETGITVNALAPAVIRTPIVETMPPAQVAYMTEKNPDETLRHAGGDCGHGRFYCLARGKFYHRFCF
jgi:3-oxoacyl-[acyl-carrier protein] reductase